MNSFLKKTFCFLLVSCLCVFVFGFFAKVTAAEEVYKTALFGSSYNSKGVSSYSTTWSATKDGFTVNLENFNNNNNSWSLVKCGNKNDASIGTITTNAAIDRVVTKVVVTIDAITVAKVNGIQLKIDSVSTFDSPNVVTLDRPDSEIGTGELTFTIDNPSTNKFYKLEFDCQKGSSNGLVTVSKVDYYTVDVVVPVSSVTLNKNSTSISPGNTEQLTATVLPDNATGKAVTWSSDNENVATVSSTGLVTAVASGSATITATSQADGTKSASCLVTVTAVVSATGVEVTNTEYAYVGGTRQLTASVLPADASNKNVSWSSADESIATVSAEGLVTAVALGSVSITATTEDGHFTDSCIFEVRDFPADNTVLSVAEALEIAELCGENQSANTYITIGTIKTKKTTAQFILTDGINDILVYKSSHGCDVGDKVKVSGNLKVYNSESEYAATSVKKLFSVTFNSNGGSEVAGLVDVEDGSKINSPVNPTKAGCPFMGWYKEVGLANAWNFESDTVTSNITLYAKWLNPAPVEFSLLQTRASLNFDYSRTIIGNINLFELYSGELTEGDYIIYYSGKAMNTTVDGSRLQYSTVTPVDDAITSLDSAIIWHIAQSGEYWTIYNEAANKYAASTGAKNQAAMIDSGTDDKALWAVTGTTTYDFVNKQNTANKVNANLRNNETYGFATYASGTGGALSLYKRQGSYSYPISKDLGGKNILSLQFRGLITSELKNRLEQNATEVTYGVLYGKTSDIETAFGSMNAIEDRIIDGDWIQDVSDSAPGKLRYTVIASNNLQGVDATGANEDNDNPEYYQFGVSINKISDANIDTSITVVAYVCIDGNYYFMQQASYSVKTLASEYVNAQDTSEYTEHLGALGYLASYGD